MTISMAMVVGWCVRECVCACVCACVHACVRDVFAIYDNILPRLIMIIIKIIFLYFTEIAHTVMIFPQRYPASIDNNNNEIILRLRMCLCMHVRACVGANACEVEHACGRAYFICVRVWAAYVCAWGGGGGARICMYEYYIILYYINTCGRVWARVWVRVCKYVHLYVYAFVCADACACACGVR